MSTVTRDCSELTSSCINPVLSATKSVFEAMLGCTPIRKGIALKDSSRPRYEISAVIGITGRANGTIAVSLKASTAMEVLYRLVGIQADEMNAEVCDAVGELTNIIVGNAKAKMEELQLSISIPNIITSSGHNVHYPSKVHPICIEFDSEIGPFTIEVGFAPEQS
ncbi:MAG: chemotaxis protein CheX [Planctomycetaceae bacterium]|nr:chemotaxis protein CheX [Planctomycetaceae bacterium]